MYIYIYIKTNQQHMHPLCIRMHLYASVCILMNSYASVTIRMHRYAPIRIRCASVWSYLTYVSRGIFKNSSVLQPDKL